MRDAQWVHTGRAKVLELPHENDVSTRAFAFSGANDSVKPLFASFFVRWGAGLAHSFHTAPFQYGFRGAIIQLVIFHNVMLDEHPVELLTDKHPDQALDLARVHASRLGSSNSGVDAGMNGEDGIKAKNSKNLGHAGRRRHQLQ